MLHTVNKSPFQNTALEDCLRFAQAGDAILLLEDGVYGAVAGSVKSALLENALKNHQVYAIKADLQARALTRIIPGIQIVGYDVFADLVDKNLMHAWL